MNAIKISALVAAIWLIIANLIGLWGACSALFQWPGFLTFCWVLYWLLSMTLPAFLMIVFLNYGKEE